MPFLRPSLIANVQFDPGRSRHAAPGQTDILDDEANNDVEPYTYGQNNNVAGIPQMSQNNAGYPASSSGIAPGLPPLNTGMAVSTAVAAGAPLTSRTSYFEASQGANVARGPSSASTLTSAGFAGRGAQPSPGQQPFSQFYQQAQAKSSAPGMGMPVAVPTGQSQTPMSAAAQRKAREAAQERQALRPANSSDSAPYYTTHQAGMSSGTGGEVSPPISATTGASGVMLHSDGGRYMPEDQGDDVVEGPSELPPQ